MDSFVSLYLSNDTVVIFTKLFIAIVLGMLIGFERILAHKTAGPRTHALVSMGSALFVIISEIIIESHANLSSPDPLRVASQIIVGVGFLGAGIIMFRDSHIEGLTTASGLWVAAGIGTAVGFGLYELGIIATALTIFIFTVLWYIESKIKRGFPNKL
ncbi:MAG: hypothetical protein A2648_02585 [Candidatus Lloydbacteria bacterium RIFCSPHIGHO2_01_FULL_41_20]|uniref:MgtC/SapB/SrpB/YhiD N-terminal domain-containing protein n=1 Tax=Candidatus Lloydbacteria bacterium RIFCSPHIGHO2_01_FULL_41_20 TaxID=1798657 RepID=A0A1G2CRE3_9BACT|nr:MAG: hypothetical protein A2648_02585 [Candidatus Lloydbacteria bacterium RIFCSPHIGHO2_01_FULL_41_20]